MKAKILDLGHFEIPDQEFGNTRLNVYPFKQTSYVKLPEPYKMWESALNDILKYVPLQKGADNHAITICSDFFTENDYQRREGIHIDGNFCVDPNFKRKNKPISSWGGMSPRPLETWGGISSNPDILSEQPDNSHVRMNWVLPYNIVIPIGKYVSKNEGGIFIISTNVGTQAWQGHVPNDIADGGSMDHLSHILTDETSIHIPKNKLIFMTSNTPHKTLMIPKGTRRTFMRLTLDHRYKNKEIIKKVS